MIAKKELPEKYKEWNLKWGAPYGYVYPQLAKVISTKAILDYLVKFPPLKKLRLFRRISGYFGSQPNNTTRIYEYPWAFDVGISHSRQKVLDIGGGFGGFQFVLSKAGLNVVNIDPSDADHSWLYTKSYFDFLNDAYDTDVILIQNTLDKAKIKDSSIDTIFCISVIEHLSDKDRRILLKHARRVLKKGGRFVLSVDLFLDLIPFSEKSQNKWGQNVKITDIIDESNLTLDIGQKDELYGFKEFKYKTILGRLDKYLIGSGYPALSQLFVLRKV
ncbi:MAG: class I SAM-dependent methyltransferase [Candidatus Roizmanbacteria bacterium]|nr:class I SAM-dependent methyltransferase [Candidatus Roizmanbacteria bacterium]